jgi:hypothetical protein
VLVSSRGEVAFTTSKGLRLALAGRRARLVARDDGSSVVLDDDRTLRWLSERDGTVRFIDLPRPGLDGCAPRTGFVAAVRTPDMAVTVGDFLGTKADEPGAVVTRACLLASATDPVIAQGVRTTGRDEDLRPVGADRTWVVFARFDGLTSKIALETLDARDRRTGRRGAVPAELLPVVAREGVAATPVAVTEQGAPAWLVRRPDGDRLLALGASGALDELDRGPAGSIADLRAEGALVKWSGPGGPREAAP